MGCVNVLRKQLKLLAGSKREASSSIFVEVTAVANAPGRFVVRASGQIDGCSVEIIEVCPSLPAALGRAAELAKHPARLEINPEVTLSQQHRADGPGKARESPVKKAPESCRPTRCGARIGALPAVKCQAHGELVMNGHTACASIKRRMPMRRRRIVAVSSMALILAASTPPTWQTAFWKPVAGKAIEHGTNVAWTMIKDVLATKPPLPDPKAVARHVEKPVLPETHGSRAAAPDRSGNGPGPGQCSLYGYWSNVERTCKDARDK